MITSPHQTNKLQILFQRMSKLKISWTVTSLLQDVKKKLHNGVLTWSLLGKTVATLEEAVASLEEASRTSSQRCKTIGLVSMC